MPTTTEILAGLTRISNDWIAVAIVWHAAVAAALFAFTLGWRPRARTAGLLISLLPISVATFAFVSGNPFNGIVLAALAVVLAVLSRRRHDATFAPQPAWTSWAGGLMIAFGWFYPHFLLGSPLQYLYAAPVGLVPCPTLAMALGFALLTRGGGTRSWSLTLAGVATFYALFGMFRLGVTLDLGLLGGAVLLGLSTRTAGGALQASATPDSLAHA